MAERHDVTELVEFIAKGLVSDTDAIQATLLDDDRTIELETDDDDRGRVIGRQGRVAKAIRALLTASGHGGQHRPEVVD